MVRLERPGVFTSEPFWSRFPKVNVNGFVPVTPNLWPICDICDGHKLSQIWICDRICFSVFFLFILAKRVWSHFGHTCHFQMWLVQPCLCLRVLGNGSGWNEIQENMTECDLCLCFMFGIRIRTALSSGSISVTVVCPTVPQISAMHCVD